MSPDNFARVRRPDLRTAISSLLFLVAGFLPAASR